MQDIGGCRAIVKQIKNVEYVVKEYEEAQSKSPVGRSKLIRTTDYIVQPRDTGYRSVHLLMEYDSETDTLRTYKGLKVKIQIRTRLQHSWATAVETASTFLGQKLKAGIGDERWLRFFALASSLFAMKEDRSIVPNTPDSKTQLKNEINGLWKELNVEVFLSSCIVTIDESDSDMRSFDRLLLKLNSKEKELNIRLFRKEEIIKATEALAEAERESITNPEIDAVLVEVDNLLKLKFAYPNYYADTTDFIGTLSAEIK